MINSGIRLNSLVSGVISCLPGGNEWIYARYKKNKPDWGTMKARYCYAIWMRHLILAHQHGALRGVPQVVGELGPGCSLGTGLAALLSGASSYVALDVVRHAKNHEMNLQCFNELVGLFKSRADIPDQQEFPYIHASLDNYSFPSDILPDAWLNRMLDEQRLQAIRHDLSNDHPNTDSMIRYAVPWNSEENITPHSMDMIFSMSVLEHVNDLRETYACFSRWLKEGGLMMHEIDFQSHGHANLWNGHWACSDAIWRIIVGRRPYLINRTALSEHTRLLKGCGFEVIYQTTKIRTDGVSRDRLNPRFQGLSDEDLVTSHVVQLSRKLGCR